VGNPARQIGWVCQCGERLTDDFECMACSKTYQKQENGSLIETTNNCHPRGIGCAFHRAGRPTQTHTEDADQMSEVGDQKSENADKIS